MSNQPHGYEEIAAYYGWNRRFLLADGRVSAEWPRKILSYVDLPASLQLSWDRSVRITRIACHRKVRDRFAAVLMAIYKQKLWPHLNPFGGGYAFRIKRDSGQLSMHAFGAAWDFDPEGNPMRKPLRLCAMPIEVIETFEEHGFNSGARWARPDVMHKQWGSGY